MLYRICDQLVILVRFRHLNGNLKLAGSGDGIDFWGVSWWHTTLAVSGRWGWFTGTCHGGARLDRGDRIDLWVCAKGTHVTGWIRAMGLNHGICDTGWIGAMELFHGHTRHWLERGNGVDLWRCITLAGMGWWDWFRRACHGGTRYWLDQGDGIDLWGCAVGHATRAGSGQWDWFEGACHWDLTLAGTRHMGARLDQRDGIDLWGHATGVRHWLDVNYEIDLWGYCMGRATGSGRWNWFVEANHGGVWHWLDLGEGIDLCGSVMRARDNGWIGAMGLIHGGLSNGKVLYGCWM